MDSASSGIWTGDHLIWSWLTPCFKAFRSKHHSSLLRRYIFFFLFSFYINFKTLIIKYGIYPHIFADKMWVAFAFAKATHIFFSKNTYDLDIVLMRTVNILTTNELIELTMLWKTGPWWFVVLHFFQHYSSHTEMMEGQYWNALCNKVHTIMSWILLSAEFEPRTLWSFVGNVIHSTIQTLPLIKRCYIVG